MTGPNYIHSEKLVLWLPMRTGARYTHSIFRKAGYKISTEVPTHPIGYGCHGAYSDYKAVLTVRNPYMRVLSIWAWRNLISKERVSWDDWMDNHYHPQFSRFCISKELGSYLEKVDYLVKLEENRDNISVIPSFPSDFDWPENYYRSKELDGLDLKSTFCRKHEKKIWRYYKKDFKNFGYERYSYT